MRGQQMRALVAAGQPAQALVVYAGLRWILADELGTDPSEPLRRLHAEILKSTVDRNNLVAPLTTFVGRADELREIAARLRRARLVTLAGPGGAGKTRLAVEVARASALTGEVWFVELAPVREPAEVPAAALAVLGVRETTLLRGGTGDPTARLVTALRNRTALLVLDNCEHQLDACAALVGAVLAGAPQVRILTTTREPLGITGELLYPVGPLPIPPSTVDLDEALAVAAVRLFVDRAEAVAPRFRLTSANLPAVVEICRRLDGLPLAIELACARLRTLSVEEIASRLGDRFRLLAGGSRTALPRHRTLAAVVGWSWDLFDDSERRLARRLAVFAGGAEVTAIEAICAGDGLDRDDVVTVLIGLVEKSFVRLTDSGRYLMLDTIQAYAATELVESGESDAVRRVHARHLTELAEAAEPTLRTAEQLTALGWLRREYDNLAAALRWAVDAGEVELAVRLVAALGWYWGLGTGAGESAVWLREVLALPGLDQVPPATRAGAYAYDAVHQFSAGDLDRAGQSARTAAELADGTGPPVVAMVAAVVGSSGISAAMLALSQLVDQPDPWLAAAATLVSGHRAESDGDAVSARGHYAQARDRFVAVGDRWGTTLALGSLAGVESLAGDLAAAVATRTEALQLAAEVGADDDRDWARANRGWEHLRGGDVEAARRDLDQAYAAALGRDRPALVALAQIHLAELARSTGDAERATMLLTDALSRLDGADGTLPPRLRVHAQLGLAQAALPAVGEATGRATVALTAALSIVDHQLLAQVAEVLAQIAVEAGDAGQAATLLGLAVAVRGTADLGSPTVRETEAAARKALGDKDFEAVIGELSKVGPDRAVADLRGYGNQGLHATTRLPDR